MDYYLWKDHEDIMKGDEYNYKVNVDVELMWSRDQWFQSREMRQFYEENKLDYLLNLWDTQYSLMDKKGCVEELGNCEGDDGFPF